MKRGDKARVKTGDHAGEVVEVITTPIGKVSDVVVVRGQDGWGFTCSASQLQALDQEQSEGHHV